MWLLVACDSRRPALPFPPLMLPPGGRLGEKLKVWSLPTTPLARGLTGATHAVLPMSWWHCFHLSPPPPDSSSSTTSSSTSLVSGSLFSTFSPLTPYFPFPSPPSHWDSWSICVSIPGWVSLTWCSVTLTSTSTSLLTSSSTSNSRSSLLVPTTTSENPSWHSQQNVPQMCGCCYCSNGTPHTDKLDGHRLCICGTEADAPSPQNTWSMKDPGPPNLGRPGSHSLSPHLVRWHKPTRYPQYS